VGTFSPSKRPGNTKLEEKGEEWTGSRGYERGGGAVDCALPEQEENPGSEKQLVGFGGGEGK